MIYFCKPPFAGLRPARDLTDSGIYHYGATKLTNNGKTRDLILTKGVYNHLTRNIIRNKPGFDFVWKLLNNHSFK